MIVWGMTAKEWQALCDAAQQQPAYTTPCPEPLSFDLSREEFAARMQELEDALIRGG